MAQNYFYPSSSSSLPAGSATAANQVLEIAELTQISGQLPTTLGVDVSANSLSVVLASDYVPALPTGAATEAKQDNEIALLTARLSGSLVPAAFDEVDLTYVTVGNGIGQVETATYKLATVTVKTLTLSYDGSDRLSTVVAS